MSDGILSPPSERIHPELFFERCGKEALIAITEQRGDLGNGIFRLRKIARGRDEACPAAVSAGGLAVFCLEDTDELPSSVRNWRILLTAIP